MQENKTVPLSYTKHKNKFKVDERPKCETGIHQKMQRMQAAASVTSAIAKKWMQLIASPEARRTKAKVNNWDLIKI